MDKNARQIGFDAIRDDNWGCKVVNNKKYIINKFFKMYTRNERNKAFTRWKECIFLNVTTKTKQMETSVFHRNQND